MLKDDKRIHPAALGDSGGAGAADAGGAGGAAGGDEGDEGAAPAPVKAKAVHKPQRGVAAIAHAVADGLRAASAPARAADPTLLAILQQSVQQGAAMQNLMTVMAMSFMSASGPMDPALRDMLTASLASGVAPAATALAPSTAHAADVQAYGSDGAARGGAASGGADGAVGVPRAAGATSSGALRPHRSGSSSSSSSSSKSESDGGD